jgi:polar amino acid transport system substrate-binding protein
MTPHAETLPVTPRDKAGIANAPTGAIHEAMLYRRDFMRLRSGLLLACLLLLLRPAFADEPPLRAGVVPNTLPFVTTDAHGTLTGFTIDLFRAIADRMQRPITFAFGTQPELIEGLKKGSYDLLPGPLNATPERAAEMLLTEGYLWSEFQFGSRAGEPVNALKDLKGRRLAVRADSPYADWAQRNAQRYGFSVLPTASGIESAQAVLKHHADASLSASPVQDYAAWHDKGFVAGLSLPETRTHESAGVRRADTELRDELEDALRCLKLNGTVARLSKTWLGHEPDAEDLENLVVPGYGVPGLAGYDPKPRKARC